MPVFVFLLPNISLPLIQLSEFTLPLPVPFRTLPEFKMSHWKQWFPCAKPQFSWDWNTKNTNLLLFNSCHAVRIIKCWHLFSVCNSTNSSLEIKCILRFFLQVYWKQQNCINIPLCFPGFENTDPPVSICLHSFCPVFSLTSSRRKLMLCSLFEVWLELQIRAKVLRSATT